MPPFAEANEVPGGLTLLLAELEERNPGLLIHDGPTAVTLIEVVRASERLAAGLATWGIGEGDRVAIWMANRREWLETWFAVARLGAVLVPLNTRFTLAETAFVLRQGRVSHLIWEPGTGVLDADALAEIEAQDGVDLRGRAVLGIPSAAHEVELRGLYGDGPVPDLEDGMKLGMIQYTSGSTAFPKGAMLRNAGLVRNGWGLGRAWQLSCEDVVLVSNPLFHCGGSVFSFMAAIASGASVVLMSAWRLAEGIEVIADRNITVAPVIDAAARDLAAYARQAGKSLPSLRLVSTAADRALFERVVASLHCDVSNVYGLTECSPNVCVGDLADPLEERLAHIGRPQEGIEVVLRDPDTGADCEIGQIGEIHVRGGSSVMLGYFEDPEATAGVFTDDGLLRTGDLGRLNAEGYLDYCGRAKLMIKSGGENIAIEEVEEALRSHPDVADAVVSPVPHERFAEVGFAFLRRQGGVEVDPAEVLAHCRTRLAGFKIPKQAVVVDDLPRTGSGKVDRAALADRARELVASQSTGA